MKHSRSLLALAAILCPLTLGAQQTTDPDAAAPAPASKKAGITEGRLLHTVPPVYPPEAKLKGIAGTVVVKAIIRKDGTLADPVAESGPEELRAAAIDAVSQWTYSPYLLLGQPVEVDTHIRVNFNLDSPGEPHRIRISQMVAQKLLLQHPDPQYPAAALAQGLQGTVVLDTVIDQDGHVTSAQPVSGPDLLRDAARQAVIHWTYRPYILNGTPVPVQTAVTVAFRR